MAETPTTPTTRYFHNAETKTIYKVPTALNCLSGTTSAKGKSAAAHHLIWAEIEVVRADNYYVDVGKHTYYVTTEQLKDTYPLSYSRERALHLFAEVQLAPKPKYGQEIDQATYDRLSAEYWAQIEKNPMPSSGGAAPAPQPVAQRPRPRPR